MSDDQGMDRLTFLKAMTGHKKYLSPADISEAMGGPLTDDEWAALSPILQHEYGAVCNLLDTLGGDVVKILQQNFREVLKDGQVFKGFTEKDIPNFAMSVHALIIALAWATIRAWIADSKKEEEAQ